MSEETQNPEDGGQNKTIVLKATDGEEFNVDAATADKQSEMLKKLLKGSGDGNNLQVPLPYTTGPVLAKVVEYWDRHAAGGSKEELKQFDEAFVSGVDKNMLLAIIAAADRLKADPLLQLACDAAAKIIQTMSVEEVRVFFGIESDFLAEEEEKMRSDLRWTFE